MSMTLHPSKSSRNPAAGFTLVELIVAVGLFAFVMLLASGAYLMTISINRQTQALATGIDSLSFALDTMTRTIRTGSSYCNQLSPCPSTTSFTFKDSNGDTVTYSLVGSTVYETSSSGTYPLTDPSIAVSSLAFSVQGARPADDYNANVRIVIMGAVDYAPGKTENFAVQTSAVMRGTDL